MRISGEALRNAWSLACLGATAVCALVTVGLLLALVAYLAVQGIAALDLAFLTRLPVPLGQEGGGIANAIVGSFKLLVLAAVVGIPVGVLGGVYLGEFGDGAFGWCVRYAADVLNGIPSIVVGIVAYALVVRPMGGFSTLAGSLALAIIIVPVVLRTTEEMVRVVPAGLREAALALGLPEWKVIVHVVLPTARRGVLAGIALSVARVAGETAPLLFTALGNRVYSAGWLEPTASLPVTLYTYAISPYPAWHQQAWAAALILMLLVLGTSLAVQAAMRRQEDLA